MNTDKSNLRLAVLIDADNTFKVIPIIEELFEEISKFGNTSIRRIYGDWTQPNLNRWKEVLPKHAIQPIQQFANTKGKNATDSALIIDAMDLLHTAPIDGFCIISSDSDFTRLAIRFRESGKLVYGFGEKKTPESLKAACNQFIQIEILQQNKTSETAANASPKPKTTAGTEDTKLASIVKKTPQELARDTKLVSLIRSAIDALSDNDDFAHMSEVKKHMMKNFSAFDPRNYGYPKFSSLIGAIGLFELDEKKQRIKDTRAK